MRFSSRVLAATAVMVPGIFASSCIPSSNSSVPANYTDTVVQAWGNSMVRFQREMAQYSPAVYKNTAMDQIIDAFGILSTINVCVRWGSNKTLTETTRQQIASQHTKLYNYWFRWLSGHDNFPFEEVKINYIGWAVRDRVQLQGSLDGLDVYTGYTDEQGDLDCNPACSVEKHLDGDFSDCPGGRDHRYHQFLFLNPAWGEYNMGAAMGYGIDVSFHGWETVGSKMGDWPLLLHEMGHTLGFLDYLDLEGNAVPEGNDPKDVCDVLFLPPNHPESFVMKPGNGGLLTPPRVTEMEGWMLRHWWSRVSRLRGWQSDNKTFPTLPNCPSEDLGKRSSFHTCSF
ncbi:Cellulose-binding family ii [Colletotrichum higginsianum IMI 349063]|uniref:Cellulose-binding family ii n=1 Tax=Colletotrichum higginsianum (strain IMI 349063) TaxID=759273 RepID=A0A1B7YN73_COLHI|nr:Cellulose-binding family ii [Colletotrichum higginsianum IMI 349063]OBR13394.1 Cellulose-binding family ii [Colletotrichum higginsianum IMI 349063]